MKKGFTLVEVMVVFVILAILAAVIIPLVHDVSKGTAEKMASSITISAPNKDLKSTIRSKMEYAYFEGQKDALEGRVRIKKVDSGYVWTESPWEVSNKSPSDDSNKSNSGSWVSSRHFW